jgi:transposase
MTGDHGNTGMGMDAISHMQGVVRRECASYLYLSTPERQSLCESHRRRRWLTYWSYPAEFKARAVTLAVESGQPIAQTARDLGVNENTFHTWIGKYHRAARQEQQVNAEHLYEELKRLRKENARLKEERDILKKAAAYFAQQLP